MAAAEKKKEEEKEEKPLFRGRVLEKKDKKQHVLRLLFHIRNSEAKTTPAAERKKGETNERTLAAVD